jgi:hypothetical protein
MAAAAGGRLMSGSIPFCRQKNPCGRATLMSMSYHGIRKINSLITPLTLRELGMPADIARLPEITGAWTECVGTPLAEHVQPIRYTAGKLVLRASSAAWVSKVRHNHDTLIRKLRGHPLFRDLIGFEVRASPLDRVLRQEPPRAPRSLSAETRRLLESVAADTTDPALRDSLIRLARHSRRKA